MRNISIQAGYTVTSVSEKTLQAVVEFIGNDNTPVNHKLRQLLDNKTKQVIVAKKYVVYFLEMLYPKLYASTTIVFTEDSAKNRLVLEGLTLLTNLALQARRTNSKIYFFNIKDRQL